MVDKSNFDSELPYFTTFPHYIKVEREKEIKEPKNLFERIKYMINPKSAIVIKDTYRVKTNTHLIENVRRDDLNYICLPYCGMGLSYELYCDEPDFYDEINTKLEKNTDLHIFMKEHHPVMANLPSNYVHMYQNLDKYYSLKSLEGIAKGKDILFIGAGHSLEGHFEEIRDIIKRNKAIVIAGGSAIRILNSHNIVPHFSLAFDPNKPEWAKVFADLKPSYMERSVFIVTPGLNAECFKKIKHGVVGTTSSLVSMMSWLEPGEIELSEGRIGVSTMCPMIADFMECKRLFYAGVDLQYGVDGKRYVDLDEHSSHVEDQETLQDGTNTRTLWLRECRNIIEITREMKFIFMCIGDNSLLVKARVERGFWKQLTSKSGSKKLKIKYVVKTERLQSVVNKLEKLRTDAIFLMSDSTRIRSKDSNKLDLYRHLLISYDNIQQMREIRTSEYNYPLMKTLIKNCKEWIELGFKELKQ